ncbi:putative secreted/membrane protein [Bacillus phage AR9]|uniref:Uncharacterized protein n=2 Tax=Bacillus phage PBS1 TaxID=10683 RepID=A0A223LBY0_BPPB1|nr:putative secreted/membrane protein [Bacillus phage AR9]YP_009664219.1 hypothetical protein FK780_gp017 [Bacillus phage PBS1]AMS01214.1 putative secreted/membrane protein [Bacillus phage AR9]AST99839.1 hypothetical protein PBI_PBS1_17 [Bacillus phage PBS1]
MDIIKVFLGVEFVIVNIAAFSLLYKYRSLMDKYNEERTKTEYLSNENIRINSYNNLLEHQNKRLKKSQVKNKEQITSK